MLNLSPLGNLARNILLDQKQYVSPAIDFGLIVRRHGHARFK